ncbi:MAG TPA: hypothetical protein VLS85_09165 [Hanamia sp.]|nr:hypothetical protein [Hanamia sp.]
MKPIAFSFLFVSLLACRLANGQTKTIDPVKFFEDTSILQATITTNMAKLFNKKNKTGIRFPASFSTTLENGTTVDEPITLETRGHFRKGYCYIPPLRVRFKSKNNTVMKPLGSLKLVSQCSVAGFSKTYLLDEYLIYKIYNLFTNMSFRVRLLNLNIVDSAEKKKPIKEYAFFLEDDKELAKRNNFKDWNKGHIGDQGTDRNQMTMVALFEYMIGNTDWSVFARHNIKLLVSTTDSFQHFYPVPYDFDYSGFVNTNYATPDPRLNISSVRERAYRGYPRTEEELDKALTVFKEQKNNIYSLINNFQLLNSRDKKDLTFYLDQFFDLINHPEQVKEAFIRNARRD